MPSKESTAENLAIIISLTEQVLKDAGIDDEQSAELSINVCNSIRENLGGAFFYIPKGMQLDKVLKYNRIWDDFRGNNHEELVKKYDLTLQRIYQIINAMNKAKRAEVQKDLFS